MDKTLNDKPNTSLCNRHGKFHLYSEVDCPWCEIDRLKADNERLQNECDVRKSGFESAIRGAQKLVAELNELKRVK